MLGTAALLPAIIALLLSYGGHAFLRVPAVRRPGVVDTLNGITRPDG